MTALARTPDGRLLRLEDGPTGVPAGSVVWTNPEMWAQNIRPEMWFPYLLSSRPDLCDLSDVRTYQQAWRLDNVWPALLALAEAPEGRSLDPEPSQDGDETMAATKKSRKVKSAGSGNGVSRSRLNKSAKIKVLTEKNPKREGTTAHSAFDLYKSGMLVSTFLEKGGRAADIAYDVKKGYIALEAPAA